MLYNKIGDYMKKCALICNLESGKGLKKNDLSKINQILAEKGYNTTLYLTNKNGDATRIITVLEDVDLVLSIGGDGTFNEIVTGNLKREKKLLLSHIPVGTTNDIGNMLGMKKNIVKNLSEILDGEVKSVDIGMINNQPFVYVAGFGKFINVPYETSRKMKKQLGYLAYLVNGAKEFFLKTKLYELEYEVDGKSYYGLYSLILISNANRIAGFNNIYKDVKLNDNKFEVVFCNISRLNDLMKTIMMIGKTELAHIPGLYCHTTNELTIKFKEKPKRHWTIDGEKYKQTSKTFKITVDQNIDMLLPKTNLDKLFVK